MHVRGPRDVRGWLASTVWALLEEKYGQGQVPAVRKISADIRTATGGETISHGHINNILLGEATNLTDGKRRVLATFFGRSPSVFDPPRQCAGQCLREAGAGPDVGTVQALASRFASLEPAQISAIEEAIKIAKGQVSGAD